MRPQYTLQPKGGGILRSGKRKNEDEGLFLSRDRKCALELSYSSEVILFMAQPRITTKP